MLYGGLPDPVNRAKERLKEGRQNIRAKHDAGVPGDQICARLTDLVDGVIRDLYQHCLADNKLLDYASKFTVVAHGGYGRRDLAPFSDVDLMLLHSKDVTELARPLAQQLSQWIVDAGLTLGFSLCTPRQAWKLAWSDATVFSSFAESRLVSGSIELSAEYMRGLRLGAKRRNEKLIRKVREARREERRKYGEIVFLLEPNVKRSRGGLRDIQLVRWIGFAKFGECDLKPLCELGHLASEDLRSLEEGHQYLLTLRNHLHFDAGKSQDQLDRHQQLQLAQRYGFEEIEGIRPVEQFMQEYFKYTSEVRYSSAHFAQSVENDPGLLGSISRTISRRHVRRDFRVGTRDVWASKSGLERLKRDPATVLELMSISSKFNKPIEHKTWREIRTAMLTKQIGEIDAVTIQRFWELLSNTGNLAAQLKKLHELRVLEQIIPGYKHARCLLQFNAYHKYTVDAHSIRAVECVTDLESDKSLLGTIYRGLKDKAILHLALLIHDLGKGYKEDHSEVGKRIAADTANRLRLSAQDKETLMFLVHKHLLMSDTSSRFDLNAPETAVNFAATVGSSERLELLLLHTYADLASVGPNVINQWKVDLLLQLYYQTDSLFRDDKPGEGFRGEIAARRKSILQAVPSNSEIKQEWWESQIAALPIGYLMRIEPKVAVSELANLKQLDNKPSLAWGRYIESQQAVEYTIATRQKRLIGTFHKITGVLSSLEMQINAADIHTQPGEIAWDRFIVEDQQFDKAPPQARIDFVCEQINATLDPNGNAEPPKFPATWKANLSSASLRMQPTQVRFDNRTSDRQTIITLFAYDRRGLLYDVSKVLFELNLVLHYAKISTHLDQVVDVFYVTDLDGNQVSEGTMLYLVRQRLLQAASGTPDHRNEQSAF